MVRRALAASSLVCWMFLGVAYAEEHDEPDFARLGTYAQLGGANGIQTFRGDLPSDLAGNGVGFDLRYGSRFDEHFGLEAQYQWIDAFDFETGGATVRSIGLQTLTLNARGYLMTGRVQPYGLLGIGVMLDDDSIPGGDSSSDSSFLGKLGLGFDFWATDWLGMNLEWTYQLPSGTLRNLDYMAVTWSVVYRFSDEEE